jgi:hypothetical protein
VIDAEILAIARSMVKDQPAAPKRRLGHFVNHRNEVKPIPGAITDYVDGKAVIARPLPETPEPNRKKLVPVSIDSLIEAEGDVNAAKAYDDPVELLTANPEPVRFAGQEPEDDPETEMFEQAAYEAARDVESNLESEEACYEQEMQLDDSSDKRGEVSTLPESDLESYE